jgi:pentatricopeptide repeat protein
MESSDDSSFDDTTEEEDLRKMMMSQYGKILYRLIETKQIEQAEKLLKSIKKPNSIIYTIMMKAYAMNRDVPKATALLNEMKSRPDCQPVQVTYNTYLHCLQRA